MADKAAAGGWIRLSRPSPLLAAYAVAVAIEAAAIPRNCCTNGYCTGGVRGRAVCERGTAPAWVCKPLSCCQPGVAVVARVAFSIGVAALSVEASRARVQGRGGKTNAIDTPKSRTNIDKLIAPAPFSLPSPTPRSLRHDMAMRGNRYLHGKWIAIEFGIMAIMIAGAISGLRAWWS